MQNDSSCDEARRATIRSRTSSTAARPLGTKQEDVSSASSIRAITPIPCLAPAPPVTPLSDPEPRLPHTTPLDPATFLSGDQRRTRPIELASAQKEKRLVAGRRARMGKDEVEVEYKKVLAEAKKSSTPKQMHKILDRFKQEANLKKKETQEEKEQTMAAKIKKKAKKDDKTQVARSGPHWFHTLGAMMKRKFDAMTAPLKLLSHPTFADVGVPKEWTNTTRVTTMRYHSLSRSPVFHDKILQLLYNIKSVYGETPTADYRLGFGVMNTTAYLILVNHESVHVVQLKDCWGSRGRAEFASLANIILNIILGLQLPSVGFSRFFSHEYTPSRGRAEQAVRILALGPNTQDVCKLQLSEDITEVEIIPAECCPPIVLVRSRPEASTLLSTLCPRLSLTDASPLRQMWILWKLLAPEESGNVREVAVTKRLLQNAATLPSHILDHIALHVESRRFVANDRGAFLPSDSPRVDVAFVTILVPPCHKDRRYRSLIDKKHPPTIRHLVTAFSRLTQVVFAFSDCGIKLRGIAPSNVLHVDGEVLVWDLANATFSEYPRSSARLPTDPEEMCGQGLRNSKTFRASVYTDLKRMYR
ncbi:BZ3500_MvSof-1268-A1-R1_Chr9g10794 [Microbotryum saponariae]|uniref:BZ3500_MvSof-1268-A1-R1_Chr9g10794 protein n=1 Tax=Microbotryum saponariae TaxID=289078 RepID=A0A2X0LW47_9BASI|nr:BZ3501_MvSof-1269-A2-R1_Chr9g10542 [Microbotryum saponariae]SDA00705.1 BZ3500_MvSof-1268-A1-R1_Chr9g10794 [Microbotryum saponariae]